MDKRCAGPTVGASYQLEYGEDRIEMHTGAIQEGQRVLLIDDLIATGGTLAAGIKLIEQVAYFCCFCKCISLLHSAGHSPHQGDQPGVNAGRAC